MGLSGWSWEQKGAVKVILTRSWPRTFPSLQSFKISLGLRGGRGMDRLDWSRRHSVSSRDQQGGCEQRRRGTFLGVATFSSQVAGTQCWEHVRTRSLGGSPRCRLSPRR